MECAIVDVVSVFGIIRYLPRLTRGHISGVHKCWAMSVRQTLAGIGYVMNA